MTEASLGYLALAALSKLGALLMATYRWWFFSQTIGLPPTFRQLWQANLVFNGVNQLVPSTVGGEIARYKWLAGGVERKALIRSQVLDKASLYVGTLGVGIAVFLEFLPVWAEVLPGLGESLAAVLEMPGMSPADLQALGRVALGLLVMAVVIGFVILCLRRQPGAFQQSFLPLPKFCRHQAISLGFLGFLTLSFFFCLRATGLEVSLGTCAMVFPLMAAIGLLPVSLSGFGLREASAVTLLGPLTGQDHMILAGSLLFGLLALFSSLPGLIMLWNRP